MASVNAVMLASGHVSTKNVVNGSEHDFLLARNELELRPNTADTSNYQWSSHCYINNVREASLCFSRAEIQICHFMARK